METWPISKVSTTHKKVLEPQRLWDFSFFHGNYSGSKNHTKTHTGQKMMPGRDYPTRLLLCFLEGVPEYLTGPLYAFLIGVRVHSERHGFVSAAGLLRHRCNVRPVGDRHACKAVTELVKV